MIGIIVAAIILSELHERERRERRRGRHNQIRKVEIVRTGVEKLFSTVSEGNATDMGVVLLPVGSHETDPFAAQDCDETTCS